MAEAFYNNFTNSKNANSAGIDPKTPAKYPKIRDDVCQAMAEEHIDISCQKVKLVNQHFVDNADLIFVMCQKKLCPDYLVKSSKVSYWKIEDPDKMSFDGMRKIRDQIKEKVKTLL